MRERGLPEAAVTHRISEKRRVFPDAEVTGYEPLIASMTCDPKDRRVLAAAVRARAEVLVTFNVRDFPDDSTRAYEVQVVDTDSFQLDQLDLYPGLVMGSLQRQSNSYKRPETSLRDLLTRLAAAGVLRCATEARRHLPPARQRASSPAMSFSALDPSPAQRSARRIAAQIPGTTGDGRPRKLPPIFSHLAEAP